MIKELHTLKTFSAASMDEVQVCIDSYISQKVRSGSNCVVVVGYDISISVIFGFHISILESWILSQSLRFLNQGLSISAISHFSIHHIYFGSKNTKKKTNQEP